VFINILLAVACVAFAGVTVYKFNSVQVFNKRLRTPNVSNSLWIFFFFIVASRCVFFSPPNGLLFLRHEEYRSILDAVRYGMGIVYETTNLNRALYLTSLVLSGVAVLALTLTLHHQKKYRSSSRFIYFLRSLNLYCVAAASNTVNGSKQEQQQLLQHSAGSGGAGGSVPGQENPGLVDSIRLFFTSADFWSCFVFLGYLVFLYIHLYVLRLSLLPHPLFCNRAMEYEWTSYVFLTYYSFQYIPVILYAVWIIMPKTVLDGPSRKSKWLLGIVVSFFFPFIS